MKFCYCDETGTGSERFAVLLGVIVDSTRMHVTKSDWASILSALSRAVGREFAELHTRNFYKGSGIWGQLTGEQRARAIDLFVRWFAERKHHVALSVVDKQSYAALAAARAVPDGVDSVWQAMGFHVALALQKCHQGMSKNKGNTVLIFDEEVREEAPFQKLLLAPPAWSDSYYGRNPKVPPLDQLVDAPYFAGSENVTMLQVADFLAYFVRRHVEITTGEVPAKYAGEGARVAAWFEQIRDRAIAPANLYPKRQRCEAAEFFWKLAPPCIRGG